MFNLNRNKAGKIRTTAVLSPGAPVLGALPLALGALLLGAPFQATARADTSPPPNPNPNAEVTGSVDVARGVVQQLEDELAKHMTQTTFNASDYKAWNTQFRARLDAATAEFENELQAQIVEPLQPQVKDYQEILGDTSLRPDQAAALKATQIASLNQAAQALAPAYQAIYDELMKNVLGFLPVPSFQFTGERENDHASKNFGTVLFDIFTLGIGIDFKHEIPSIREADYAYTVNSLDGSVQPLRGDLKISGLSVDNNHAVTVSALDSDDDQNQEFGVILGKQGGGLLDSCVTGYSSDGTASFDDPSGYEKAVTADLTRSRCDGLDPIDLESSQNSKTHSVVFDSFIASTVKNGCESQVCLSLKESDLLLTLNTLEQQLDKPFQFQFSDQATVSVGAPNEDVGAYLVYLATPVTDASLPFDTSN